MTDRKRIKKLPRHVTTTVRLNDSEVVDRVRRFVLSHQGMSGIEFRAYLLNELTNIEEGIAESD